MVTDGEKAYRITFSKSLADYIIEMDSTFKVERIRLFLTGAPTKDTKLFAVCKKSSLWPLRVTFFREMAEMWLNNTTVIMECFVERLHD